MRATLSDETFDTLPPHFDNSVLGLLTVQYWNEIVDGYDNYPSSFKRAFPFLLASLFYLRQELPATHPLWLARVFTSNKNMDNLRGKAITGVGNCIKAGMKATGIPPYLANAAQLSKLIIEVEYLRRTVFSKMDQLAAELPNSIANAVAAILKADFTINRVAPVSARDIEQRFREQTRTIVELVIQMNARSRISSTSRSSSCTGTARLERV